VLGTKQNTSLLTSENKKDATTAECLDGQDGNKQPKEPKKQDDKMDQHINILV
jgi:hypothetical protein